MTIEDLWCSLRQEANGAQRRIDALHPLDFYADFEPPDHPGLILFCQSEPPDYHSLNAIRIEKRLRSDGRWALRIFLVEPKLIGVFKELCRDVIVATRAGVEQRHSASFVLARIERWRALLLSQSSQLGRSQLRGLIGELLFLDRRLIPVIGPTKAIASWVGPFGTAQDFRLPSGKKVEVKTTDRDADHVLVNGLDQLDGGSDRLVLAVVRLEDTGREAEGSMSVETLIEQLRTSLGDSPEVLRSFNNLLSFAGWNDLESDNDVIVRLIRIDEYEVDGTFPRLVRGCVPTGVVDATYKIALPLA